MSVTEQCAFIAFTANYHCGSFLHADNVYNSMYLVRHQTVGQTKARNKQKKNNKFLYYVRLA